MALHDIFIFIFMSNSVWKAQHDFTKFRFFSFWKISKIQKFKTFKFSFFKMQQEKHDIKKNIKPSQLH